MSRGIHVPDSPVIRIPSLRLSNAAALCLKYGSATVPMGPNASWYSSTVPS